MWLLRTLAPWLAAGAALGLTAWLAQFVHPVLIAPGLIVAAWAAWLLLPPEHQR